MTDQAVTITYEQTKTMLKSWQRKLEQLQDEMMKFEWELDRRMKKDNNVSA